jgi:hypothetical protein
MENVKEEVLCTRKYFYISNSLHVYRHFGEKFYAGHWKNDKVHGQGTLFWSKGTPRYTGDWVEGKKHGWGKQWREDESRAYQGRFENDQRTMGTSFKEDGNTIDIDGNHQPA